MTGDWVYRSNGKYFFPLLAECLPSLPTGHVEDTWNSVPKSRAQVAGGQATTVGVGTEQHGGCLPGW